MTAAAKQRRYCDNMQPDRVAPTIRCEPIDERSPTTIYEGASMLLRPLEQTKSAGACSTGQRVRYPSDNHSPSRFRARLYSTNREPGFNQLGSLWKMDNNPMRHLASMWTLVTLFFCVGCSSDFGDVSGTVTLDGKPLKDIAVRFEDEGGSATIARTDAAGKYVLQYSLDQMGAPVGKHKVTIFTPAPVSEGTGDRAPKEVVPARYNSASTLVREVKPGNQVIDFDLTTDKGKSGP